MRLFCIFEVGFSVAILDIFHQNKYDTDMDADVILATIIIIDFDKM